MFLNSITQITQKDETFYLYERNLLQRIFAYEKEEENITILDTFVLTYHSPYIMKISTTDKQTNTN